MKRFINDESGVITIEWVVLGSALFFIGIAMSWVLLNGVGTGANRVQAGVSYTEMPDEMRAMLDAEANGS